MTKLFLHIGPHKTGSTYIQKFFHMNRDRLLNVGVNYPNVGIGPQYGQHKVIQKVKTLEQKELDDYLIQFVGSDVNLVSSENFDRLNLREIEKLGQSLSKLDVMIIYYYRNYMDLLPSWWQEEVKHGSRLSFYEFVLPHVLRPFSSNIINPGVVLDLYANVFGKDNITIIDYDRAFQNGNILRPICDLLGIELGAAKSEIVNPSLKLEIVEIIRALNTIAKFNRRLQSDNVRLLFIQKRRADEICSQVDRLAGVIRDHMKPLKLSDGLFGDSVSAAFRKDYGSRFFNNLTDTLPNREVLVPSDSWMLKRDALLACERIYQYVMTNEQA